MKVELYLSLPLQLPHCLFSPITPHVTKYTLRFIQKRKMPGDGSGIR
jgi:hypothetical protein